MAILALLLAAPAGAHRDDGPPGKVRQADGERHGPWWVASDARFDDDSDSDSDSDGWRWLPPGHAKKVEDVLAVSVSELPGVGVGLNGLPAVSAAAPGTLAPGLAGAASNGAVVPDGQGRAPIPEPSALLLFASGAVLAGRRITTTGRSGARRARTATRSNARVRETQRDVAPLQALFVQEQVPSRRLDRALKRGIDIVGAVIGLLLAAPILALAALAIRLDSPGPAFFRQVRCGHHGRRFAMWKLRTMQRDAEQRKPDLLAHNAMDGPVFKLWDDPRITRVGRVLRRFSLDELPQLWNVLRGEMSLVGPRPPLEEEVARYSDYERLRLSVKPGLTCEWQVRGRNLIGFREWVELDLDYIRGWSLRRDLTLLAKTLPAVVRGTGAA